MRILITGGAGFIGSHVAEAYLQGGHEVIIVDNLSSGRKENIPADAKFYLLDIRSAEIEQVFKIEKPDLVNHHAAQISVAVSSRNPILDSQVNSQGLLNILQSSVSNGVRKFIFISTGGAIYGDTENMPTPEEHDAQPLSPYGIHKLLGENYLRFYKSQYGLDYSVLRYSNVYGPRQNPEGEAGVVAILINQLLSGRVPTIYAYPDEPEGMSRDYVYVEDVARVSLLAAVKGSAEIFNIGTEVATRTGTLYRKIGAFFASPPEPQRGEPLPGDLRNSCLSTAKAKRVLNWTPRFDLAQGLKKTVDHFKEN
ncbi:UDP-glucose 4-epimerase [subsurface metagenome]